MTTEVKNTVGHGTKETLDEPVQLAAQLILPKVRTLLAAYTLIDTSVSLQRLGVDSAQHIASLGHFDPID